jgi:hypothetical protein
VIDLLITYDLEGWAYHSRAVALARHAPADFRVRIAQLNTQGRDPMDHAAIRDSVLGDNAPDLIFVLCYHQAKGVRRGIQERGWHTRLIASWNNGWPSREADFHKVLPHVDAVLINNREYWERAGMPARSVSIANGVDLTTFRLSRPIESRPPRVIWCGSEYHRQLKGYDDLIVPLFSRLREEGVECEALLVDSQRADKRSAQEMSDWYNSATVLVVASETEGTPNPAFEAAACGCTLVSTRVGNMPELIRDGENGFLVDRDLESLHQGVRRAVAAHEQLATQLHHDVQSWGWTSRAADFFQFFRAVVAGKEILTPPRECQTTVRPDLPDLSSEMTVFVSTVGAASFPECMACLERQDSRFRLEVIEGVAPMSAAFQLMMDRCQTPYYIQVDEDMLLHPHAVRVLHERILAADPAVPLVVAWLWDAHLGHCIQGVKAFRHRIVSRYPFADVQSCEKDQLRRMAEDGHHHQRPPETNPTQHDPGTLGLHGTHYDAQSIFERYSTLEQRRRRHPDKLAWFEAHGGDFLRRFRDDPSEVNLMALMGILAGRLAPDDTPGEKDFHTYGSLPGLREALVFHAACIQTGKPAERTNERRG